MFLSMAALEVDRRCSDVGKEAKGEVQAEAKSEGSKADADVRRQFEVDGLLIGRGPYGEPEWLSPHGLSGIGSTYPAGPVVFLSRDDVPSQHGQWHHELLGPVHEDPTNLLAALRHFSPNLAATDPYLGRWRMTRCADPYPACIVNGDVKHSATEWETERLARIGIHLGIVSSSEGPSYAVKTRPRLV